MNKIAFIVHSNIRNRSRIVDEIKEVLSRDNELIFLYTERKDHSIALSSGAANDGASHIICVGGDGSLNEIANGVMNTENNLVRVGVLPHGTGNDFVKSLHITPDIAALKKMIDADWYKEIDLGSVEYTNADGKRSSRYFINISDVGMGGVVAEKISKSSKWMGAMLTYQTSIMSTLISYRNQPIKVKTDRFSYEGNVMNLIIANGKYFGSGLGIAPDALQDDGLFDIIIVGEVSLFDYLKNLGEIKKCRKLSHPQIKYAQASELSIESPVGPQPIDMDGEFIGYSPMKVSIVPKALKFIAPH